jgi:FkbM family methyltransferase
MAPHLLIRNAIQALLISGFRILDPLLKSKIVLFSEFMATRDARFVLSKKGLERYVLLAGDLGVSRKLYIGKGDEYLKVCSALDIMRAERGQAKNWQLPLLLDIGANMGHISIPLLKRGLADRALAFEPDPMNHRLCRVNILLNALEERITLQHTALGAKEHETLSFELSEDNSGDHRVRVQEKDGAYQEASRKVTSVASTTLDSFFPELPRAQDCLAWIDVQGYEGFVLQGARRLLVQRLPLGLEFWPYGLARANSFSALFESLAHYEYFYDLGASNRQRIPVAELSERFEKYKQSQYTTDILLF